MKRTSSTHGNRAAPKIEGKPEKKHGFLEDQEKKYMVPWKAIKESVSRRRERSAMSSDEVKEDEN